MMTSQIGEPHEDYRCPRCRRDLRRFSAQPIFSKDNGLYEAVVFSCPFCGLAVELPLEEIAQLVAERVMKYLA